jgi:SAM-dependent methyltransferase
MGSTTPSLSARTARLQEHFGTAHTGPSPAARAYRRMLGACYRRLVPAGARVLEIGCGAGHLLAELPGRDRTGIDLSPVQIERARARVPEASFQVLAGEDLALPSTFDVIIISDTLNLAEDVQRMLAAAARCAHPDTRLIVNFHNSLWRPLLSVASGLGLKTRDPDNSWLASSDVLNLLRLTGWETIQRQGRILVPVPLLGLEGLANRWLAPFLPWLCLTVFIVARLEPAARAAPPRVSVIVPARNEAGNIAAVLETLPPLGATTEIVFVEGNSTDDTWEEIRRVAATHPDRAIKCLQQPGRGKGDAVRAGFAAATGDVLMILDADLTTPAEDLPKFLEVLVSGRAEFANGVRLVYPMDDKAMPFLNLCANKAFSLMFTWLLGQPVKDTLCGTKALSRAHYDRIAAGRAHFGDFDPFGDFDLLFGAARLHLKIADIPVRYRERTYGTTNIQRWRHGAILLRMVAFGARKLRFT